jgi:tRNA A37 threonylcarbamoyladenosine dehydratase
MSIEAKAAASWLKPRLRNWTTTQAGHTDTMRRMETTQRFAGIDRLYGQGSVARLAAAHVGVIGIGGVGSWAAEALARSGVGRITLIDADDVCVSNTNRQLHALAGNYGRGKVAVMAERLRAIDPGLRVDEIAEFLTAGNLERLLDRGYDLVIDACDAFRTKVETIVWCRRRKLPLVVCGSAGGRSDVTRIQVRDLSRTEHDAMLSLIRKKLRGEFGFPRNRDRYFGVSAVYSLENVRYPQADGSVCGTRPDGEPGKLDCGGGLGAAMHVTAAFAMAAVGRALERLLEAPAAQAGPRAREEVAA